MTVHVHEWKPVPCECGGYDPICARERKCECGAETLAPWCDECDGGGLDLSGDDPSSPPLCPVCKGDGIVEP